MIGQKLGSYRVVSLLGEGGMGMVYLGEHESLGRKAAIKVLRPELAQREEVVQRFFNEALAANQIKHPGIVDIYDFARAELGAYLVMEFLDGEPLSDLLARDGALPLPTTVLLTRRIASPLTAAHRVGIVHRDLKPDNIFVLPDPDHPGDVRLKLLDFGIAKLKEQGVGQPGVQTQTGLVLGTPFYMSPEQCHGARAVDHRSDIYALGVIAYQLLTGQLPFMATGFGELVLKQQTEQPPPIDCAALGVPPAVESQILRAMAKDPAARFDSAEDFASALALAAGLVDASATLPPLHEAAQLASVPTATSLPHTVLSSPGQVLPMAPTELPTPAPVAAPASATAHPPTLHNTPAPSSGAPVRSHLPLLVVFVALLLASGGGLLVWTLTRGPRDADRGSGAGSSAAAGSGATAGSSAASPDSATNAAVQPASARARSLDDVPEALVPAGPFRYGAAAREVTLPAFRIDRHEVTVAQYRRCVQAGVCDARKLDGTELPGQVPFQKSARCNWSKEGSGAHPINCLTWVQARQYCAWAGKRLPSEQEWEKSARGTDGRRTPWKEGPTDCKHAVVKRGAEEGCGRGASWAVGSRSPAGDSPYGVQDLLGNVAEWVEDVYRPAGAGSAAVGAERRSVRGGSFTSAAADVSALTRIGLPPAYRLEDVGFRCAR